MILWERCRSTPRSLMGSSEIDEDNIWKL